MIENVRCLGHNAIKFSFEKIIYVDPFKINENYNDADIILITHDHYDHFSIEDIEKVKKDGTILICPYSLKDKIEQKNVSIKYMRPNEYISIENIEINSVFAYNVGKNFHPKSNEWLGYIINYNNCKYYIAGDTDFNEDIKNIKCDVAFVPVGGTYTMTATEAAEFVNTIKPKIAVPTHYGSIVGSTEDAKIFIENLDEEIKGVILI